RSISASGTSLRWLAFCRSPKPASVGQKPAASKQHDVVVLGLVRWLGGQGDRLANEVVRVFRNTDGHFRLLFNRFCVQQCARHYRVMGT
ncbi:MAG: hypothetical protein ABI865_11335, partial [Nitrosospira sp.]